MAIQLQGCETLPRRLRRICEGDSQLDAKLVARYQRAWRKHGLPNVVPHSGLPTTASLVAMAKRGKTRRVIENGKLIWRRPAEGFGDTVEHLLWSVGIAQRFKAWFGTCGCERRRQWLNRLLPYSWKPWKERLSLRWWSYARFDKGVGKM